MGNVYWRVDSEHIMIYSEVAEKSKVKIHPFATYTRIGNKRPFAIQWCVTVGSKDQEKIFETLGIKKKNYVKS